MAHFITESASRLVKRQLMMEELTAVELMFDMAHCSQLGVNPALALSAIDVTAAGNQLIIVFFTNPQPCVVCEISCIKFQAVGRQHVPKVHKVHIESEYLPTELAKTSLEHRGSCQMRKTIPSSKN